MKFKKYIHLVVLLSLFFTTLIDVKAASNNLYNIDMEVHINQDGSANIIETWNIDVYEGTEVYKVFNSMDGSLIRDFYVIENGIRFESLSSWDIDKSRKEKKYKSGLIKDGDDYELCFGVGEYGHHTYTMYYTIDNFVEEYADVFGFNYRLIDSDSVIPDSFSVRVFSEALNENTKMYAFGFEGTIYLKENNGIKYIEATNILEDGSYGRFQYTNIFISFFDTEYVFSSANQKHRARTFESLRDEAFEGSDYVDKDGDSYYDEDWNWSEPSSFSGAIVAVSFLVPSFILSAVFIIIISISKNNKLYSSSVLRFTDGDNQPIKKKEVNYFRDIPCGKDKYLFYYVAAKANLLKGDEGKSGMISAILLSWIREGIITFVKGEKKGVFSTKETFSIDFSRNYSFNNTIEDQLYSYFKSAAGTNGILENKEFEKWCKRNYTKIDSLFNRIMSFSTKRAEDLGYIEKKVEESKVLFFTQRHTVVYHTSEFREEMKYVIGFEKFIKEFSSLEEKQVLDVILWEDYLIFASILGLAEEVEKEIGKLYPEFVEQSNIDIYYTTMATRHFVYSGIRSATRAKQAAESSSSFNGGGGSSSFGGGGSSFSGGGGGGVR